MEIRKITTGNVQPVSPIERVPEEFPKKDQNKESSGKDGDKDSEDSKEPKHKDSGNPTPGLGDNVDTYA